MAYTSWRELVHANWGAAKARLRAAKTAAEAAEAESRLRRDKARGALGEFHKNKNSRGHHDPFDQNDDSSHNAPRRDEKGGDKVAPLPENGSDSGDRLVSHIRDDGGLTGRVSKAIYNKEEGGIKWGSIIGGLAGITGGFFMGDFISSAGGASGSWLGIIAVGILSIAGMAFGSRLGNSLVSNAPAKASPNKDGADKSEDKSIDKPKEIVQLGVAIGPDGKIYSPPEKGEADMVLEGAISSDRKKLTVTHAVFNANSNAVRFALDTPQQLDLTTNDMNAPANKDVLDKIAEARRVVLEKTSGDGAEKQITADERTAVDKTIVTLDPAVVDQYNSKVAPQTPNVAPPKANMPGEAPARP